MDEPRTITSSVDVAKQNQWFGTDENGTVFIVNETELDDGTITAAMDPIVAGLTSWITGMSPEAAARRQGGFFERDKYVTPEGMFDLFKLAKAATEDDDIVAGTLDISESLAVSSVRIECGNEEEEDIWNQWGEEVEIEDYFKELWREMFKYSQVYCASLWGENSFIPQNKSKEGKRRKKVYDIFGPTSLTTIDPLKMIPVGSSFIMRNPDLAYIADKSETTNFDNLLEDNNANIEDLDPILSQLIAVKYNPTREEIKFIQTVIGGNFGERSLQDLYLVNPERVWRHTATKPGYARFCDVRMKSIFELLDIKRQLRQADRAHLIGAANFILLVKKGDKDNPAMPEEINALKSSVVNIARVPIIVGDHRLAVEIITPKLDMTLKPERWNAIDARIAGRLNKILVLGGYQAGAGNDDSIKLMRVIARSIESQRSSLTKKFHKHVLYPMWRANDELKEKPSVVFNPRNVGVDFDPNLMNLIQVLFDSGKVSTDTMLQFAGLDLTSESNKRALEKEIDKQMEPRPIGMAQAGTRLGGTKGGGGANSEGNAANKGKKRNSSDTPNSTKDS